MNQSFINRKTDMVLENLLSELLLQLSRLDLVCYFTSISTRSHYNQLNKVETTLESRTSVSGPIAGFRSEIIRKVQITEKKEVFVSGVNEGGLNKDGINTYRIPAPLKTNKGTLVERIERRLQFAN